MATDGETSWKGVDSGGPVVPCLATLGVVERLDLPRCAKRASLLLKAHLEVEKALREETLSLELLAHWHAVACPEVGLRTETWAYGKGGAERYSLDNGLLDRRLRALGDERSLTRSLRAYLDILFFHPFQDGNSRAARLAFHYFASRDGLAFRTVEPLFRLSLPAGERRAYDLFQQLAMRCLETRTP